MNTSRCTSSHVFTLVCLIAAMSLVQNTAYAQSSQYQRAKKPAPAPVNPASPAAQPGAAPAPGNEMDKKVDITDLEQKYWIPKDTEFRVVQNRTYTKEKRFAFTLGLGPIINDQYSKGTAFGFTGNYYLSERMGIELTYMDIQSKNNTMTDNFLSRYAVMPDHNKEKVYIGAGFNWVPIYAKLSLLEKQIIYFDMSITPGIGIMQYDQQFFDTGTRALSTKRNSAVALSIDIAQHFFLNRNFAFRLDVRNKIYNADVKSSLNPDQTVRTTNEFSTIILFGVTYYH